MYPNPLVENVVEETVMTMECLNGRDESNDEVEVIDVVGGGAVKARRAAESRGFFFVDALRRTNSTATSGPGSVLDMSGMPTYKKQ